MQLWNIYQRSISIKYPYIGTLLLPTNILNEVLEQMLWLLSYTYASKG